MCGLIAKALYPKMCRTPVQAMPVVPATQQTEHRVKEQSLKHESPLSEADDFTLLVESDSKTKEIVEELLDFQGLLASAVGMPAKAVETEAHAMVTFGSLPSDVVCGHWRSANASARAFDVVLMCQGFFMGEPFSSVKPTAQPWNETPWNTSLWRSKNSATSGLCQPSQSRGHALEGD